MKCRLCRTKLKIPFADLGFSPLANNYIPKNKIFKNEKYYKLKTWICKKCLLVQNEGFSNTKIIFNSNYSYFSSVSKSFLKHAKEYANKITSNLNLNKDSYIIEIGSNYGYLLKNFKKKKIYCLGIEPSKNTAEKSEKLKIKVIKKFFTYKLARELSKDRKADLIIANNVFAHVPNIRDFTQGLKKVLDLKGCINIEFPHLTNLIKNNQFDTIYHEHFFYYSLHSVINIFKKYNLKIWKVEKIHTHGGSLRIYASHYSRNIKILNSVKKILKEEKKFGILNMKIYENFQKKIEQNKKNTLQILNSYLEKGKKIYGYGAAAKCSTILNYYGIKKNQIKGIFDNSPAKFGKYLPGCKIPILKPTSKSLRNSDIILIFAWNLKKEIIKEIKLKTNKNIKVGVIIPKFSIKELKK